ncbi:MAG TPA: hypothetical protein VFW42_00860, partial [Fluviicoccus sp.]|nr:hypothetical protein [Fluviicoccus sp.]
MYTFANDIYQQGAPTLSMTVNAGPVVTVDLTLAARLRKIAHPWRALLWQGCANPRTSDKSSPSEDSMKALVAVKRVVDYNVKVRVKADKTGVELANVKMAINP